MSCCLYRHFTATGELLYVGITVCTAARTGAHRKGSPWFRRIAKIEISHFGTRELARKAEREAIKTEHPVFNRMDAIVKIDDVDFNKPMTPLSVIKHYAGQQEAADALNITRQCVNYWLKKRRIPPKTQAWIQLQTGGKLKANGK